MKISLYTKAFQYLHFREIVPLITNFGYDGLELDRLPEAGPKLFKELTNSYGLDIVALQSSAHVASGSNIASGNADKRFDGAKSVKDAIDFARDCACPIVQIRGMYCWPYSSPYKGFWKRACQELRRLASHAESSKVKLSLHLKHTIAYLINSPWAARDMIEEVGSSALGVTFDTGTFNLMTFRADSLVGFVEILKDVIIHVHVSDNDGYKDFKYPPGRGNINWEVFLMALRGIQYDGYLSVDLPGGFMQRDPHGASFESIKYLRNLLDDIENGNRR